MMKLVLLAVALLSVGQILPSCGDNPQAGTVIGWVEAKGYERGSGDYFVTILGQDYQVAWAFFQEVKVGDLVKWDGKVWTILKKASLRGLTASS
jgi:hypothetical protein